MNKTFYSLLGVLVLSVLALAYVLNTAYVPANIPFQIPLAANETNHIPTITGFSISTTDSVAAAGAVNIHTVKWNTSDYPSNAGVDINLMKMIGSSPVSYSLVRAIASNVSNTGSYSWEVKADEFGHDVYIEVVCTKDGNFPRGCESPAAPIPVK